MLIYQSLRPNSDADKMGRLLTLLDALLEKTPVYQMACTISLDAVKLAYDTINNERTEDLMRIGNLHKKTGLLK